MFNRMQSAVSLSESASFVIPDQHLDAMPLELRELCEVYNSECKSLDSSNAAASDWPVSLFLPSGYEERYAYPLIIWFHEDGSSENELDLVMNAIGDQNYCGLAIRGNKSLPGDDAFGWTSGDLEFGRVPLAQLINVTARRLRRAFHIHSERIFVAGSGAGANVALKLFAQSPEWFAGAIAIDPSCEEPLQLLPSDDLRGKSILHTASRTASNELLAANVDAVRLLRTAGVDVDVRITEEPLDPCSNDSRFIDGWLISKLNCEKFFV